MDILNANKLNRAEFNPLYAFIFFFWTAIDSSYILICMIFISEFTKNADMKQNSMQKGYNTTTILHRICFCNLND